MLASLTRRARRAGRLTPLLLAGLGLAACGDAKNATTGAISTTVGPSYAVDARTTTDCTKATANPAKTVCLTNAFLNTLSATQKTSVQLALTSANAVKWSNLPCGSACRNGLQFSTLSSTQLAAAVNVAKAALSASGYSQFNQTRLADDILSAASGSGGGSGPGARAARRAAAVVAVVRTVRATTSSPCSGPRRRRPPGSCRSADTTRRSTSPSTARPRPRRRRISSGSSRRLSRRAA